MSILIDGRLRSAHPEVVALVDSLEAEVERLTAERDEALDDLVVVRALVAGERDRRKRAEADAQRVRATLAAVSAETEEDDGK